ncbi:NAD-dependent epimerase/dehydratase family protein [bacterium]|nr:MAG: NAD-dependent epimerase/dehydratase family protein [bacterium]|tara:strand:+ start:14678 stop:15604 length:927 start_codon:yes stop_codon:yes gene_type:complete
MKVAVFGSTGFVGKYILKSLLNHKHEVHTLVRNGSENKLKDIDNINISTGDVTNNTSLDQTMMNCSTVIYNIGIIRQFPSKGITYEKLHYQYAKKIIDRAVYYKIKHFILMSANGVKLDGTGYQSTKFKAEEYLKKSGLNYTIFRPSLIFGKPTNDQEFCSQLRDTMLKLPIPAPLFFPGMNIFEAGKFKMSPIHVENVADFFVKCIQNEKHFNMTYNLGGSQSYNWKKIIHIISSALNKRKLMIPAPVLPIKIVAFFLDRFKLFPITRDQLTMLLEGNSCDIGNLFLDFNITPIEFNKKNLSYLRNK